MDFVLLWIECVSLLLLWMGIAVIVDANLPRGARRLATLIGLTGVAVTSAFELTGTLGIAIKLELRFATAFFVSVALAFLIGSAILLLLGLGAEEPGLAPRAASWPWKPLAIAAVFVLGLAATTLHDMRIAASQELERGLADLRELQARLDPPVPAALNAAPLYLVAYPHLIAVDQIPGGRAAFEVLEGAPAPTKEQALAAPLAAWTKTNAVALKLIHQAALRPAYSTVEEAAWAIPPASERSRFAKVAELQLREPRPNHRVVGHLTERKRAANLLETLALQDAFSGQRAQAAEEMNTLLRFERHSKPVGAAPEQVLEKLLVAPGWTDEELARLDLSFAPLRTRLQLTMVQNELRDLTQLSFLESGHFIPAGAQVPWYERPFAAVIDLSRGFIDILGTSELVERNRAAYDGLWEALFAPPDQRYAKLAAAAKTWRTFSGDTTTYRWVFFALHAGEARRACAEVGVAIARYRLQHGHAPQALVELVPDLLLELPRDPFNGQTLHYKSDAAGIAVYSVGPDGRDDSGGPLSSEQIATPSGDIAFHLAANP